MESVWFLTYTSKDEREQTSVIGIYKSESAAKDAIEVDMGTYGLTASHYLNYKIEKKKVE